MALPRLWSSMSIPLHAWRDEDSGTWYSQEFHRCVELFLKRSKEEPLDLEFCEIFDEPFEPLEAGLLCISKHSKRWRKLAFPDAFRHMNFIPPFFQTLQGGLPNLQHLTLDYDDSVDDEDIPPFDMTRFNNCPSLKSLEYRAQFLPWVTGFPWAQIQSLDLERCRFSDIVGVMPLSKGVQKLRLEDLVMNVPPARGPAIVLNSIHLLSIHAHHDISSLFFQFFTLPALSSLIICASHYGHLEWNPGAFVDRLLCSSSSLTSLTLRWLIIPDKESLYRLLVLIPTIVNLSVEEHTVSYYGGPSRPRNMVVTPQFLEDLVVSAGNESSVSFLPRLSNLTLIICPLEPSSRLTLSRVLASRTLVLRSFDLTVKNLEAVADAFDYESLQCFRGLGIRVRISCPVEPKFDLKLR